MKKRFWVVLLFAIVLVGCGNKKVDIREELISEKWCDTETGDTVLEFYKTGTGRLESSTDKLNFEWNEIEDCENAIRIEFDYLGADNAHISSDFELVTVDEVMTLQYVGNGKNYVHLSDFTK